MDASRGTATVATKLCVVLVCFAGRKTAGHVRRDLLKQLGSNDHDVVDDVIVRVDGKRRAQVHDPRRVVAGTLTSALTWGAFGLVAGGTVRSLVLWAIIGAICGGLFAYLTEHLLTKRELKRIGAQLGADSSVLVAFVQATDESRVLASVPPQATAASVAAIGADLSARAPVSGGAADASDAATLSMTLLRYGGEHTARTALASLSGPAAQVELIVEVPPAGRPRVVDPSQGVAAMSKSDIASWGLFGLAFGLLVGFAGGGGLFGALDKGIVTGVAWGVFGMVAGALYGLWAGRAASSRRVRGLRALLPPDTSTALVWIGGASTSALDAPARSATASVTLSFHPSPQGVVVRTA